MKSLETFVSKSLKIHIVYLIAESEGKNLDYNSMVLNRIKALDSITNFQLQVTFNMLIN